jgi:hypothetical protein
LRSPIGTLQIVTTIAAGLSPDKRSVFLERLAAQIPHLTGGRRPGDADVERAARAALRGLLWTAA